MAHWRLISLASVASALVLPQRSRARCAPARAQPSAFVAETCAASACRGLVADAADADGDVWVRAVDVAVPMDFAAAMAEATTGDLDLPACVGRLRGSKLPPVVDALATSIPKEQLERCAAARAAVLERLLEAWLDRLDDENEAGLHFEALRGAASLHSAAAFERLGFVELDAPDLTSLGRGEAIATHAARLPAAVLAFEARSEAPRAAAILARLKAQPPPPPLDADAPAGEPPDPWASAKFVL